jgi:uridine kinase
MKNNGGFMDKIIHRIANWVRGTDKKIIIGISGHGASGKTTFANELIRQIGRDDLNYINTDPYIIGSSQIRKYTVIDYEFNNERHQDKMTACHPGAHNILALERDLHMIRNGLDLFTMHREYAKRRLISHRNKVNIVEGMTVAFTDPSLYNLKIYLYTDGDTELRRRSHRDVKERGTNIDYLRQSHEERRIQYELFMHPYSKGFDIVINNSDEGYFVKKDNLSTV